MYYIIVVIFVYLIIKSAYYFCLNICRNLQDNNEKDYIVKCFNLMTMMHYVYESIEYLKDQRYNIMYINNIANIRIK